MEHLPEPDWKHLRAVSRAALDRYCDRVLAECTAITADPARTAHERYLALFKLLRRRDDELARAFNDLRRSTAIVQLMTMRRLGVVTPEEWMGFSAEMRERITFIEQSLGRP
jgi:hypothetical protein